MKQLHLAGLKYNIDKCKFVVPKVEKLGYIITLEGIKPEPKKLEAVINIEHPKDKYQVSQFLSMVQYYSDLWTKRSDILAPLGNWLSVDLQKIAP